MDIRKELQARSKDIRGKIKDLKVTNTRPYRIYFRGFAAGKTRQCMNEIYFLEGLLDRIDEK